MKKIKRSQHKKNYLWGFYVLDPYTMNKDTDIKGVNQKDAWKVFNECYKRYK